MPNNDKHSPGWFSVIFLAVVTGGGINVGERQLFGKEETIQSAPDRYTGSQARMDWGNQKAFNSGVLIVNEEQEDINENLKKRIYIIEQRCLRCQSALINLIRESKKGD